MRRSSIGDRRGDVYRWVFDANISPIEAAARFGNDEILALLLRHASPAQRLLAACAKADGATAKAIVSVHPNLVANFRPDQMRLIADKAQDADTGAVALMLDLGFDQRVAGPDHGDALHWAAFHGNTEMVRMLLRRDPPIGVRDSRYHATPLGGCVYGAVEGWSKDRGDYATTVQLLLDAGETFEPSILPTGRDDVDAVLRAHLSRPPAASA
jgi:ankyrin repeat protein